jgi:hypothetical protein
MLTSIGSLIRGASGAHQEHIAVHVYKSGAHRVGAEFALLIWVTKLAPKNEICYLGWSFFCEVYSGTEPSPPHIGHARVFNQQHQRGGNLRRLNLGSSPAARLVKSRHSFTKRMLLMLFCMMTTTFNQATNAGTELPPLSTPRPSTWFWTRAW